MYRVGHFLNVFRLLSVSDENLQRPFANFLNKIHQQKQKPTIFISFLKIVFLIKAIQKKKLSISGRQIEWRYLLFIYIGGVELYLKLSIF